MKLDRTRLLDRTRQVRDAKLVLVATEGERTEPDYFHALQERDVVDRSRLKIHVLPARDGESSPLHVLERLVEAERAFNLQPFDERWLVLDVDRWPSHRLADVCQRALAKSYRLAISNPCFEVWLLLHVLAQLPGHLEPKAASVKTLWKQTKEGVDPHTRERVATAVERARTGDAWSGELWPQGVGTHVHRLVSGLLKAAGA